MSGFAGIIHLDGAPVDPELLEKLRDARDANAIFHLLSSSYL